MNPARRPAGTSLTLVQLVAFGFPAMTHALIASPLYTILPTFYAANTAVTLAQIGTIAALSRVIDAINDPLMGYLSDRTRTRFGSRKPWLAAAVFFCAISVFQLFSPPADAGWLHFLLWSQVLYTGFTMFEVPRSAWSAELSRDYDERARIGVYVGAFNIAGSLSFYLLPVFMGLSTGNSEINASTLSSIAWIYILMMPAGILLCLLLVPRGQPQSQKKVSLPDLARSVFRAWPSRRHFAAVSLWGLGQGIILGGAFIFYTDYMQMGSQFAMIMGLLFIVQIASLPLWSKLLPRFDRHRVWAFCVAAPSLISPLVLLIPKGEAGVGLILVLVLVQGTLMAPNNFLPGAILGDVIDYDLMKSGSNKAGNLFAVQMVLGKIAIAAGGGLAFNILAAFDYQVNTVNTPMAETGLILTFLFVPALFHVPMAFLAWNFPINRRRQKTVQKWLARRSARQSMTGAA